MTYSLVSKKTIESGFYEVSMTKLEPDEDFSGWIITAPIEDLNFSADDLIPIDHIKLEDKIDGFCTVIEEGKVGDVFVFNSGFEQLVKIDRRTTKTVDEQSFASNQGLIPVNFLQWFTYNKLPLLKYFLLIVASLILLILIKKAVFLFLLTIGYAVWQIYRYTLEIKECYAMGNILPGIVVSTYPLLIASFTDLTKGRGEYPVIRIDHFPSFLRYHKGAVETGARIPMLAIYCELEGPYLNYWNDFSPRPVEFATKDRELLGKKYYSISEEEWLLTEELLAQVNTQKVGITAVNVQTSAWKEELNKLGMT